MLHNSWQTLLKQTEKLTNGLAEVWEKQSVEFHNRKLLDRSLEETSEKKTQWHFKIFQDKEEEEGEKWLTI